MSATSGDKVTQRAENNGIAIVNSGNRAEFHIHQSNTTEVNSVLFPLLRDLVAAVRPSYNHNSSSLPVRIEEKILFNNVIIYQAELQKAMNFIVIVESLIDDLESEEEHSENIFLWAINQRYLSARRKLLIANRAESNKPEAILKIVRENADQLIESVKDSIRDELGSFKTNNAELLDFCLGLIACYGFISCAILERPPNA